MENRTRKLTSGLALVLFALALGGCQLLGSEKSSEANDSASDAPEVVIPAEKVESSATEKVTEPPKDTTVIAAAPLTIPTDPDARVKAVRKGRSNPFADVVAPQTTSAKAISNSKAPSKAPSGTRSALKSSNSKPSTASLSRPSSAVSSKKTSLPRLVNPGGNSNEIVLPPLPQPTLAKQVTVQGVMMLGGQPKAIVKAPNEDVARSVQAGDYLSDGQILVSSIDMSNPQSPKIILQESGQKVTVGVGKPADPATDGDAPSSLSASLPF